jgi:hypothetical protein
LEIDLKLERRTFKTITVMGIAKGANVLGTPTQIIVPAGLRYNAAWENG